MIKLSELRVHDWMFDHTENEFVPEVIQSITKSRWNHVKRIRRIVEPTPDGIFIAESVSNGYIERSLRESTGENDIETRVKRYCADNIGGKEYTPEQMRRMTLWDDYYLAKGIGYGFVQIAALGLLKQINNDSIAGMYLGKRLEEYQQRIEEFWPQMICSESSYRKDNESGIEFEILKDSKHLSHYSGGDVLERYKSGGGDVLNPVIADWLSPHDLFMATKLIELDTLDYSWR
jgi:hypothetical protein